MVTMTTSQEGHGHAFSHPLPNQEVQGKKLKKQNFMFDLKNEIDRKISVIDHKDKIMVNAIPPDFFIRKDRIGSIMIDEKTGYPILIAKTTPIARGLGCLIYVVSAKKIGHLGQITKKFFSQLNGFQDHYNGKNIKIQELPFTNITVSKAVDVIVGILKLFLTSADMSMILRQF